MASSWSAMRSTFCFCSLTPSALAVPTTTPPTSRVTAKTAPRRVNQARRSGICPGAGMTSGDSTRLRTRCEVHRSMSPRLLPLDGPRGLGGDVVGHPVDALDLVDDPVRHRL